MTVEIRLLRLLICGCQQQNDFGLRLPGIEPGTSAWKADILPLNYKRLELGSLIAP
jgi:hypothetical protein